MTSVATVLISNNYKADLLKLRVVGIEGVVYIKQSPSECRTGKVGIYTKLAKEKAVRIGFYQDNRSIDDLKEYVCEELIESRFVVKA